MNRILMNFSKASRVSLSRSFKARTIGRTALKLSAFRSVRVWAPEASSTRKALSTNFSRCSTVSPCTQPRNS